MLGVCWCWASYFYIPINYHILPFIFIYNLHSHFTPWILFIYFFHFYFLCFIIMLLLYIYLFIYCLSIYLPIYLTIFLYVSIYLSNLFLVSLFVHSFIHSFLPLSIHSFKCYYILNWEKRGK